MLFVIFCVAGNSNVTRLDLNKKDTLLPTFFPYPMTLTLLLATRDLGHSGSSSFTNLTRSILVSKA